MVNLDDAGLNLRTIGLADYATLIADINYNFTQILAIPAMKGQQGISGSSVTGATGTRGTLWTFVSVTQLATIFPGVTANDVTISWLNARTSPIDDLLDGFGIPIILDRDIFVLPSNRVVIYRSGPNEFQDTGLTFRTTAGLTTEDVVNIVNGVLTNNSTAQEVYKVYSGIAKNFYDNGPSLNIELNPTSAIDIDTAAALAGVNDGNYKIIGMKEAVTLAAQKCMFLAGHSQDYHRVLQETLRIDTVNHAPGIDDFPGLTVLQNDYNSGILLGYSEETSMRKYARIYRTASSLRIAGSYDAGTSYFDLSDTAIYAKGSTSFEIVTGLLKMTYANIESAYINLDATFRLGNTLKQTHIIGSEIHLPGLTDVSVLGTSGTRLVKTFNVPSSVSSDAGDLISGAVFGPFYTSTVNSLSSHDLRITALETAAASGFSQRTILNSGNLNTLTSMGQYKLYANSGSVFQNLPNGDLNQHVAGLQVSLLREASVSVFRYVNGNSISLVQQYNSPGSTNYLAKTYVRCGESVTNGTTWSFSNWQRIVNSDFTVTGSGVTGSITETGIVVNHNSSAVSGLKLGYPTITPPGEKQFFTLNAVLLDAQGHPVSAEVTDIRSFVYTKQQMDLLLANICPKGTIIAWNPTSEQLGVGIPDGWLECNLANHTINPAVPNLSRRSLIGRDISDLNFALPNQSGGQDSIVLTEGQMPAHTHTPITPNGRVLKVPAPGVNGTVASVDSNNVSGTEPDLLRSFDAGHFPAGSGLPVDIRNPYTTTMFLYRNI